MAQQLRDKIVGQLKLAQTKGKKALTLQRIAANLGTDALIIFEECEKMVEQGTLRKSIALGGLISTSGKRREVEVYALAEEAVV